MRSQLKMKLPLIYYLCYVHFSYIVQPCYAWYEELSYNEWQNKEGEHLEDMASKAMAKPDNNIIN